ncbi:YaiO family outer membrane beta-barrel protein [Phaeocystidibacter luteus]|uniref:YaiO family outer membrane beta-barrel protein n=1 Tax=Phaeocystidibacter luteus TaxID=911197 RepID=A0A6N6RFN0_9FLAO|nr:YaiO family outer membrane beta-barrel protein [Phaeocystidibacter luteus]KAB2809879.1 YaiO family outer membrane beta-barrel protein [Phaeocystidibacter luteus]
MKYNLLFLLLAFGSSVFGQLNADSLFVEARKLAENKEYDSARTLLMPALREYPAYHDIRNYIARTYAWEEKYDEALAYYKATLSNDMSNTDAWWGIGDVYLWSEQYLEVINTMNEASDALPDSSEIRSEIGFRKATAYYKLREFPEALEALENTEGGRNDRLRQTVLLRLVNHSVDVLGSAEFFSEQYDPMYYGTVQVGQSTKYGVGIARFNTAYRFGETGYQAEVDLYPIISETVYGYINYGFSPSAQVFPQHRVGGEIYSAVGSNFEASLGVRYLYFGPGSDVTMYTGSVNYYLPKYLFSFRPFITPQEDGTDFTGDLLVRRYLNDSRSWVTLRASYGFSPDARRIQVGAGEVIEILETTSFGAEWQQAITQEWLFVLNFTYTYQELPFDPGNFYSIYAPLIGIKRLL